MSATGSTPTLATSAGAANLATALPSIEDVDRIANTPAPLPVPSPSHAASSSGEERKEAGLRKIPKKTTTVIVRKPATISTAPATPAKHATAAAAAAAAAPPHASPQRQPSTSAAASIVPRAAAASHSASAAAAPNRDRAGRTDSSQQQQQQQQRGKKHEEEEADEEDEDDRLPLNIRMAKREETKEGVKSAASAASVSPAARTAQQRPPTQSPSQQQQRQKPASQQTSVKREDQPAQRERPQPQTAAAAGRPIQRADETRRREQKMRDVDERDEDEEDEADDEEEWSGSAAQPPQQAQPMLLDEAKHDGKPAGKQSEEQKERTQQADDNIGEEEEDEDGGEQEEEGAGEVAQSALQGEDEAEEEEPEEDLEPPPSSDEEEDREPPESSEAEEEQREEDEEEEDEDEYEDTPKKKKKRARSTSPKKKSSSSGRASKPKGKGAAGKRKKRKSNDDEDFVDDEEDDDDRDSDDDDKNDDEEENNKSELFPSANYTQRSEVLPLVETHGANKWWNRESHKGKQKWESLEHNGVLFPAAYVAHGVPLLYDGSELRLSEEAEEVATMYASMLELSEFIGNPTFNSNFFKDWRSVMSKAERQTIQKLDKCNFTRMHQHVMAEREKKKAAKKEDPALAKREKEEKDRLQEVYGYALVDGYKEKVGNFRVEPPGLFRGRGKHPKTGRLKLRVKPEDIIINIGVGVPIPPCPPGHKWKGIMHNNRVTWLAFWHDNVNDGFKYVWLAASSKFKGQSDINKYTKAQRLKGCIDQIRANYYSEMRSKEYVKRQRATAIYLIDVLALRVGNEKDKSEVADTVGCCSLRCEHLTFEADFTVTLNFLGKDSMQYLNTVKVDSRVYVNLQEFARRKKPHDDIFDSLSTTSLNEHLKSLMDGLTAKVFRTYNASHTLQNELTANADNDVPIDELVSKKVAVYTKANRVVAILCNHQRSVPKGHEGQMKKLIDRLEAIRDEKEEIEDRIEELSQKAKKGQKAKGEADRKERRQARDERKAARKQRRREEAVEKAKRDKREYVSDDDDDKPRSLPSELGKLEERLEKVDKRLADMSNNLQAKDESKTVALGTSKINYMDPRITVAWCKEKEVPIEKIFNKSLLAKFPWAMEVPSSWRF